MLVSEFDYHLPDELIAQQPMADRAGSRLLHVVRNPDLLADRRFREFPELLRPSDLLVFNNTKVLPARLYGHRSGSRRSGRRRAIPLPEIFCVARWKCC